MRLALFVRIQIHFGNGFGINAVESERDKVFNDCGVQSGEGHAAPPFASAIRAFATSCAAATATIMQRT